MAMVEELGGVFASRSMQRHVEELRLYWLSLVRGAPVMNRRGGGGWAGGPGGGGVRGLRLPPPPHHRSRGAPPRPMPPLSAPAGHPGGGEDGARRPRGPQ